MGKSSRVRVGLVVLVLFLVAIFASGCGSPPVTLEEYYHDTWLFGEHPVLRLDSYQGIRGEFKGVFFLASGTVGGSFGTEPMLTFAWEKQPGERYITTLPISKFRFEIDEGKTTPSVEFQFQESGRARHNPACHPEREWLEEANPNDYLMGGDYVADQCSNWCPSSRCSFDGLRVVVVRISSSTIEQEVYVPK